MDTCTNQVVDLLALVADQAALIEQLNALIYELLNHAITLIIA